MDKLYSLNHSPIDFHFSQNPRDFMVKEVPLYEPSNEGEHLIVSIFKKGLSTFEMINFLSNSIGCSAREIGYAGLKDKNATTTQNISIHKSFQQALEDKKELLKEKNITILSCSYHSNKLKIGHLKGNNFFIRLKKVTPAAFVKIDCVLKIIKQNGLPNYFGYQRFGKDGNNYLEGKKIAQGELRLKNKKINDFLISSYQSYLFNQWLSFRIKINKIFESFQPYEIKLALEDLGISLPLETIKSIGSQKHFFKLFEGDLMHHYPYGKLFELDTSKDLERFMQKDIVPTGILSGSKVSRASKLAKDLEINFDDEKIKALGSRRFAWIWVENLKYTYKKEEAWLELEFFLPKGSYATIFLEELAHRNIKID